MTKHSDSTDTSLEQHGPLEIGIDLFPDDKAAPEQIDAGAEFAVRIRARCPESCDLTGDIVSIRDAKDVEIVRAPLLRLRPAAQPVEIGEEYATEILTLVAPHAPGAYVYNVGVAIAAEEGVAHADSAAQLHFAVRAHAAHLHVWDLPAAIGPGEAFSFRVGLKCSSGCSMAGRTIQAVAGDGSIVAEGALDTVWPGTKALYSTQLHARAPSAPGDYEWRIGAPSMSEQAPHAAGEAAIRLRVVPAPEREILVRAYDSKKRQPIKGIHVFMHPYRALTDESGVARIRAANGRYKLVVSGFKYAPYEHVVAEGGDLALDAELFELPDPQIDPLAWST